MSFVKKILFLRPFNQEETKGNSQSCLRIETDARKSSITVLGPTQGQSTVFDFYNCYWSANDHSSLSEDIRQYAFQNLSRKFSTCVLLYGPMNTGKSYVLLGGPGNEGLLLTTLREVFTVLSKQRVALLVYEIDDETEQIFDLIQGEPVSSFADVTQKHVRSFNQAVGVLDTALARRQASTHTFFTIKLIDKKTEQMVAIDFVLLENECKEKDYPRPRPSFVALHELIHAMGGKSDPDFSKCKLTEHFQEYFQNGRFRMIMLATVGPSSKDYDQIMRVLTYCTSTTVPRFTSSGLPEPETVEPPRVKVSYPPQPPRIAAPPPYLSSQDFHPPPPPSSHSHAPPPPSNNNNTSSSSSTTIITTSAPYTPIFGASQILAANNNNNNNNNSMLNAPFPATIVLTPPPAITLSPSLSSLDSPLLAANNNNSREFDALYRCVHKLTQLLEDYDRGVISSNQRTGIRSLFPSLSNTSAERIQALEDCIALADRMRGTSPLPNANNNNNNNNNTNNEITLAPLPSPVPTPHGGLLPSQPFDGGDSDMNGSRSEKVLTTLSRLEEAEAKSPNKLGGAMKPKTVFDVMLVEDVPVSSKLGLNQLKRAGFKPMSCENGGEAIAKFKTHFESLKFILMDINMPVLSGIQATELIRKWEAENRPGGERVVILGLTGNVGAKSLRSYREAGMNGCIVKGTKLDEAIANAQSLLADNPNEFVNLANVEMSEESPKLQPMNSNSNSNNSGSGGSNSNNNMNNNVLDLASLDDHPNLRKSMHMRRISRTTQEGELLLAAAAAAVAPTTPAPPAMEDDKGLSSMSFRGIMAKNFISKFGAGSEDDQLDIGEDSTTRRCSNNANVKGGLKKRKPFSLDDIDAIEGCTELPAVPPTLDEQGNVVNSIYFTTSTTSPTTPTSTILTIPPSPSTLNEAVKSYSPSTLTITRINSSSSCSSFSPVSSPSSSTSPLTPTHLLKPSSPPDFAFHPAAAVVGSVSPPTSPPHGSPSPSGSPSQAPRTSLLHITSANKKPNLLLVEDVKMSQKIGQAALTRANFRVVVAQNGEEAVEMFKKHHESLEVVLMDVLMPGMGGVEATEIIRRYEQENGFTPKIVLGLTGNVDHENLLEYERCGMNGCIVKGKHLEAAVAQVIKQLEESEQFVSYVS